MRASTSWRLLAAIVLASGVASAEPVTQALALRVARASARNRARFAAGEDPVIARAAWPTSLPVERQAVLELGAAAFSMFPVGVDDTWQLRIADDDALGAVGVTIDARGEALGLIFVERSGGWRVGYTCVLCHSREGPDASLRIGPANAKLRYGDLLADAYPDHPRASEWRAWGAGRIDVTDDDVADPLRIPDLVGLDRVRYLQQSGGFAVTSNASLAGRIESVLSRAPVDSAAAPTLSAAIASWLRELPQPIPPNASTPSRRRGAEKFHARCSRCHDGPALGGRQLIDAGTVGTDDRAARDRLRGTGAYRVPPLLGVGSRTRLFHDGALRELADVIDPRRFAVSYRGGALAAGAVPGHPWGMKLTPLERESIVDFLRSSSW